METRLNRSQMTSKCGKNKKVAHEAQPSVSLMFLPHFDFLCDLLLNRRTATWNLFVLYNKKLKYKEKMPFISNNNNNIYDKTKFLFHFPTDARRSTVSLETRNLNFTTVQAE